MDTLRIRSHLPRPVALLAVALIAMAGTAAGADDDPWLVRVEPLYVDVQGHDPQLASFHGGSGGGERVDLETESGLGYHFEMRHDRGRRWGWGLDFFWFTGAQNAPTREVPGGSGTRFRIAGRDIAATEPGQVLFFQRRDDTDLNAWTADFYATRRLSANADSPLRLLVGLRNADFDNDNRGVAGILGVGGTRIDASSNYSRMIGPIVGVIVDRTRGRSRLEAVLTQSVVQGDVYLAAMQSDYVGPFVEESEVFTAVRSFARPDTATIPITDLRLRWTWSLSPSTACGLGASVSHWASVPVPPGVGPAGGLDTLNESSITLSGLMATLEVDF